VAYCGAWRRRMQGGGRKTVRWRGTKIGGMEANGMRYRPSKPALMAPRPSQKIPSLSRAPYP